MVHLACSVGPHDWITQEAQAEPQDSIWEADKQEVCTMGKYLSGILYIA